MGKGKGKKEKKKDEGPKENQGPDPEAEFEILLTSKNLELAENKAKAERLTAAIAELRSGNQTLNDTLVFVKKDSSDILAHLERDMLEKRSTVALLSEKVDALTVELEATLTRIAELEKEREEASSEIAAATRSIEEKLELETLVTELRATITNQTKTIQNNDIHISSLDQQLKTTNRALDDLQLELSRSTATVQVSDNLWTLKRAKQRLKSANVEDDTNLPYMRARNSLNMVGRMAILFGGTTKDGSLCSNELFVLNTETNEWERNPGAGEVPGARGGHAVVLSQKKRLLMFGGRTANPIPLSNDLYMLNPDNFKWVKMQVLGDDVPEAVEKATMCCSGENILLLGGDATQSHVEGQVELARIPAHGWLLSIEGASANKCTWRRVEFSGRPPRRCNASLTESPDGRYLFLFGGADASGECTNDVFVLNVDRSEWSVPEMVMGTKPPAREGHAATIVGRFLVVSGGYNEHGRLFDAHVLDTESMVWEALDTSLNQTGAGEVDRAKCTVIANDGRRVFMMVSNAGSQLDELVMLDITIPDEAFQQNVFVRKEVIQVEAVQDENDMRQIKLGWKPPTNTKARVVLYKVRGATRGALARGGGNLCRGDVVLLLSFVSLACPLTSLLLLCSAQGRGVYCCS